VNEVHAALAQEAKNRTERIEDMDEEMLVQYAQRHFDISLNPDSPIEMLREAVREAVIAAAQEADEIRNKDMLGGDAA
jgi:hypothetical protein